jgi:hypothetical protein
MCECKDCKYLNLYPVLVEALKRIANIENGPDNGSAQWRASASESIASEALAKCKAGAQ